ncbi:hypothetical protein J7E62_03200 [Variovorax paradoxus]|nr:hypothetical protein [Variovorax paradoxus]
MERLLSVGTPSVFSCPDCGGVLFELKDGDTVRYRCHTGHAFSLRSLASTQEQVTDEALWTGLRALHEKEAMLRHLAAAQIGDPRGLLEEADELATVSEKLRRLTEKAPAPRGFVRGN